QGAKADRGPLGRSGLAFRWVQKGEMVMCKITILTPGDAEVLLKYFTGVSAALSKRFDLGFIPDEEHLTSLLCELLDDRGAALHSLSYSISDLNADLQKQGSLLQAAVSLQTTSYNKHQERYSTQSDFGIILEYKDYLIPSDSFKKGVLVQAKRLFPDSQKNYTLGSKYESFNADQHERLSRLREYYVHRDNEDEEQGRKHRECMERKMHHENGCHDAFQYLLYNPSYTVLPKRDQELILHRQLSRESNRIFDYTHGLFLYEKLKSPAGTTALLDSSNVFVGMDTAHALAEKAASAGRGKASLMPFDLNSLTESHDIREMSFPWYLVFRLMYGTAGCSLSDFLKLVSGSDPGMANEYGITPPRYVLNVMLTAGTNSNKD
ncbi:MAG: hypothetical protein Q8O19_06075, partial [Rectinemataceae bacterium]|nr:hypothetical protein [Rectinemataceae bacterium]